MTNMQIYVYRGHAILHQDNLMSHHNLVDEKYQHMQNNHVVILTYDNEFDDF